MEFEFPAEAEAFRKEAREFLDAELPEWWRGYYVEHDVRIIPLVREICEKLAEKGWRAACHADTALAKGLSTHEGALLSEQVAADLDLPFTDPASVLA